MHVYLSMSDVADRTGRNLNTLKAQYRQGKMPAPDAQIGLDGKVWYGWLPSTIDAWAPPTAP